MSWKRIYNNSSADNYAKFVCDTLDDIETLPNEKNPSYENNDNKTCGIGSIAFIVSTNEKYILNNENEWKFFGGTNSGDDIEIATLDETKEFLNI